MPGTIKKPPKDIPEPQWMEGELYTKAEIEPWSMPSDWRDRPAFDALPDDTLFVAEINPISGWWRFQPLDAPDDPLVAAREASTHAQALRDAGKSFREISRLAGVSPETVHRVLSGHGKVRLSTLHAFAAAERAVLPH